MSLNNKGYSMVELMIALGIGAGLVLFAASTSIGQQKLFLDLDEKVSAQISSRLINKKLGNILESIGGQGIAPYQAIAVENNCAARWIFPDCQGSDRITILGLKTKSDGSTYDAYSVISYDPSHNTVALNVSGTCDLSNLQDQAIALYFQGGQILILKVIGYNNTQCALSTAPHLQGAILSNGAANTFLNASMSVVKVITYYLDRTQKKIFGFIDQNNDSSLDSTEVGVLYSDVLDFQLALGYDFNPRDGAITEDTSSTADEWLYNHSGENWGTGVFTTALASDLKMIQINVAIGVNTKGTPSGAFTLLDGPTVTPVQQIVRVVSKNILFKNQTNY